MMSATPARDLVLDALIVEQQGGAPGCKSRAYH
jgi:hypothetical protein